MDLKKIYIPILTFLIISIGAFIRINQLDKLPSGFYVDEVAIGYNAYSILLTGKDEYGKEYPLFLRSFGAYSSPLYTYLTTIPIYFWGLNIFSVRILSAISGVISIFLVYLILKRLNCFSYKAVILGILVFTLSPWSILFSRGAFEANFAFMLVLASFYLLLKSLVNKIWLIPAYAISSLATYAYQAERLISFTLLIGFLLLFHLKNLKLVWNKWLVLSVLIFVSIQVPYLLVVSTPAFTFRSSGLFYSDSIMNQAKQLSPFLGFQVGSLMGFIHEFLAHFFTYLSPRNLFFAPDPDPQRSLPEMSVFFSWLVIPFIVGIFGVIQKKGILLKTILLLLVSFISVPSLTKDPFSTLRSLPLILPVTIIITEGFDLITKRLKIIWIIPTLFLFILSLLYLYRSLAVYLPNERATIWGYGFSQLSKEIEARPTEGFVIDNGRSKPAYIQLAFFLKYPPSEFHQKVDQSIKEDYYNKTEWDGYYNFANLKTRAIVWEQDIYKALILVGDEYAISPAQEKEHFLTPVFEIKDPLGKVLFRGFRTNPVLKCKMVFIDEYCRKVWY